MKKAIAIIVFGLLWCNVGVAEYYEMNKCFPLESTKDGKNKKLFDSWDSFSNAIPNGVDVIEKNADTELISEYYSPGDKIKKYEDEIYSIDTTNGIITNASIRTDEYALYLNRLFDARYKHGKDIVRSKPFEKISTNKYYIVSYAGGFIKAETEDIGLKEYGVPTFQFKITIDLKNSIIYFIIDHAPSDRKDSTSKFQCNKKSSETEAETASGTAFFINNKGNLLTNNHVVDGCKELKINYFDKEYDAKLIATDKTLDLALLKVDLRPKSYISFSDYNPKKLQKIYVAGYPFGKGLSDDLKISSGIISSLKGIEDNSNELQIDAAINHGNSGGPIVGEGGELVAIAVSGLAKEMAEGINFGIKSSAAMNFLGANDIDPSRVKKSSMNNDRLLKLPEESTLFISCTY